MEIEEIGRCYGTMRGEIMGENRKIYAALLGAGTVGSGVYKLAGMQEEDICLKTGAQLEIKKILVRNPGKLREGIPQELFTDNWQEILEDPEIQIVIEVMGGIEPARTYVEEAMKAGKQVVTANKDLLAEYGDPLFEIATENKCDLQFEAAVAGAIPIIRPLRQSLAGSQLTEIMGIVNGTTNYILTKMSEEGMGYHEALDMAMRLGYAEADPTADVEGYDAGRKIAIMASIAFSSRVTFPQVYTEGITKITAEDIRYAKEFGYVIKLLGITKLTGKGIEVKVHPTLIPDSHPLATVRDSFNAVFVHGTGRRTDAHCQCGTGRCHRRDAQYYPWKLRQDRQRQPQEASCTGCRGDKEPFLPAASGGEPCRSTGQYRRSPWQQRCQHRPDGTEAQLRRHCRDRGHHRSRKRETF